MFKNISVPGYELKVLEWPAPEEGGSLKDYARKFLDQIDQSKPVDLLGVSFGGMLCVEISEMILVNKVFLVSSLKNISEFPLLLKTIKHFPIYKTLPDHLICSLAKTKRKFIGFEKSFEPIFLDMLKRMPKNYFSRCIDYILHWDRKTNNSKLIHIHGTSDKLLTCKTIKDYYPIKNGSHVMVLTHAVEINAILNKELNG